MKWRSTFWLVGIAFGLLAYIWFAERHTPSTADRQASQRLLSEFRAIEVDTVQVQRTNSFILQVQRTNEGWEYLAPFSYPAQKLSVQALLEYVQTLNRDFLVAEGAAADTSGATNKFGLDQPSAILTLVQSSLRAELKIGAKTLSGEQVYAQLVGSPGVYALPAQLLELLPVSSDDWRDRSMMRLAGLGFEWLSVSNATLGFTVGMDLTNGFVLRKPFQARANGAAVSKLIQEIYSIKVAQFVSDNPRIDLEPFGLQPPVLECRVGADTNTLASVQFGSSPTNDANLVYARLSVNNNLVLLPRAILEQLRVSVRDLRDPRMFSFVPEAVDSFEVRGPENFSVRREGAELWRIQPGAGTADSKLMHDIISAISDLRVLEFTKDIVTDFSPYALDPPTYTWILRGTLTNLLGVASSNAVLAQLELGGMQEEKVYARRPDEASVYGIRLGDAQKLPDVAWKLRDRKIWSFTTNEVVKIKVEQGGQQVELLRSPDGKWTVAEGGPKRFLIQSTLSLEETVFRLGRLNASVWSARGIENRTAYGFKDNGHRLTIDTRQDGKPRSYSVELGGTAPSRYRYATTQLGDEWWFFEMPMDIYFSVMRDLSLSRNGEF
jgi:hypothetical protein